MGQRRTLMMNARRTLSHGARAGVGGRLESGCARRTQRGSSGDGPRDGWDTAQGLRDGRSLDMDD